MKLAISDAVALPEDAVTQTFGCIGRRGAGKTYLAGVLAEQMLDLHAQIIVLDAVGNWYGLRVSTDGKSKGKDIFVIGGEHGDIPVTAEAGAKIAKVLVEKNVSAVLDISRFRQNERKRFAADFGEEFFHLKKSQRSAVHLFIEEAQLFIPQRCGPEEARMLGAFENIVRLGRNYGIGATCISQRPQSVNKEVLSQIECLCVLQVNGTHERKALEDWVQEAGADRKLVGELPGLNRGEGYVWSPSWLKVFKKVHFAKKTTFDASATPEVGRSIKTAMLSVVDVAKLKADLEIVIKQAELDDPKALKKRIAELERQAKTISTPIDSNVLATYKSRIKELESHSAEAAKTVEKYQSIIQKIARLANETMPPLLKVERQLIVEGITDLKPAGIQLGPPRPPKIQFSSNGSSEMTGPEQRILNAIAWLESIGVSQPEQPAVAFLAGYTYGGGAWANPRGKLRSRGHIEYLSDNRLQLTDSGRSLSEYPSSSLTNEALHAKILSVLPGPERKLLSALIESYPGEMTNEELAKASGYTVGGGAFANPRGRLRTLGLVEYPQSGSVRAREILFPER